MRIALKIGLVLVVLVLVTIVGGFVYVMLRWDRSFDVPYPEIEASEDPEVIAHGEYLVYGPAACVDCHADVDRMDEAKRGERVPLSGGRTFDIPLGVFHVPNITSHPEHGVGRYEAREIARVLRSNVHPSGRMLLPFMEYDRLSDEDVTAIVSYLLSSQPVGRVVPERDVAMLGKALFTFAIEPTTSPTPPPVKTPEPGTPAYGSYLVNDLAMCAACHTERDPRTQEVIGAPLAGGNLMPHKSDPSRVLVTPNLTPDPETGVMSGWSQEDFVKRFREGTASVEGSVMPWSSYQAMSDADLVAIYEHLNSLDPVVNDTEPAVRPAP